jgi:tetratricopeptide (TPR) repeat protein
MKLGIGVIFIFFCSLNLFSQQTNHLFMKGMVLFQQHKYTMAVDTLTRVILSQPSNASVYLYRGSAYYAQQFYSLAEEDFLTANRLKAGIASYNLALVYAAENRVTLSMKHLADHLTSRYKKPASEIRTNSEFQRISDSVAWIQLWKNNWYSLKEEKWEEINQLLKREKYLDVLDELDNNRKYLKDHRFLALQATAYEGINNYKAATDSYSKAIHAKGRVPAYYFGRASVWYTRGKYRQTTRDLQQLYKLDPVNIEALLLQAAVYYYTDNLEHSLNQLTTYLDLFPESHKAHYLCGKIYMSLSSWNQAVQSLTLAIAANRNYTEYFVLRGDALMNLLKYTDAYNDYTMALDMDPMNFEIYYKRGIARLRLGEYKGACSDWNKAAEKGSIKAQKQLIQFCE